MWKFFITKLQSKMHKLNRTKPTEKPKNQINKRTKAFFCPCLSCQSYLQSQRGTLQPDLALCSHQGNRLQETHRHVYIDQVFKELVSVAKEPVREEDVERCLTSAKKNNLINEQTAVQVMIKEDDSNEKNRSADDLWESLVLASPQMYGINERAEEFIARFRAEMQLQETLARR